MTALSVKRLARIAHDRLGAEPEASGVDLRELVNQAGHHLVSAYPWLWLEGRSVALRPRAAITLTDATWTEGGLTPKTLTKLGAFASYSFLSGDTVEIEDGTGATTGTYEVASKTSSDAIVLVTSIGSAANGQTDIDGTMLNDQIEPPSDFDIQAIIAVSMSSTLLGMASLTGQQSLLNLRQFGGTGQRFGFRALVSYVRTATASGAQPAFRLEIYPRTTNTDEQLVIQYRGGWRAPLTDEEVLSIPDWMNSLYIEVFRACLMGNEEPEDGTTDERLARLRGGVLWADAIRRDTLTQPSLGRMVNGWMSDSDGVSFNRYASTDIGFVP